MDEELGREKLREYKNRNAQDNFDEKLLDLLTDGSLPMSLRFVQAGTPPGPYQLDDWVDDIRDFVSVVIAPAHLRLPL